MTIISLTISIIAIAFTILFRAKNAVTQKALQASQAREQSLTQTLVDVMDEAGNVRGQLALPGHMPTSEAMAALEASRRATVALVEQVDKLNKELAAQRENNKNIENVIECINNNSPIQIRLPGKRKIVNKTPCGEMCKKSFWDDRQKLFLCGANQGRNVDKSREVFLDHEGQCVHFERSTKFK